MAIADIHGVTICYETTGHGAPLVLLLPQSTGPTGRRMLVDTLAQHYTVITYDQRGTGGSSSAPDTMSIAMHAEDVAGLIKTLRVNRASLLCHSTGCGIGLSVAARYPEWIGALVLAAPWTHADAHLTTMQNLRKAAASALAPKAYAHFNAALLFPPEFRRTNEAGFNRLAAEAVTRPHDATAIARRLDAILAFDARPLLSAIQSETLVAVAVDDQLMPPWFAANIGHGIAKAELVEFDGGGHMLLETRTAEFAAVVLAFLARRIT